MFVIVDTEFTAWQGSNKRGWSLDWEHQEIVQIAALKIGYDKQSNSFKQLGEFNQFVRPVINPILSDYFIELTGITQSVVDEYGVGFDDALDLFNHFCEAEQTVLISWGRDDIVLNRNISLNKLSSVLLPTKHCNLRAALANSGLPIAGVNSGGLAGHFGIELLGQQHNALHDVKSLFVTLVHLQERGLFDISQLLE